MADISKINGVPIANIEKLDAVLAANIAKVNGLVFSIAPAFTGLLDTYTGAAAGYSTRRLASSATVLMRVRRSGDDIEADVEFDSNNEISLTSPISNASSGTYTDLADFVDHSTTPRDAFVDEWKDQSGSSNHAAQATAANQPKLYDAINGLLIFNGKTYVNAQNNCLLPAPLVQSQPLTIFAVARVTSAPQRILHDNGFSFQHNVVTRLSAGVALDGATTIDNTSQHIFGALANGTSSKVFYDGTEDASGDAGTTGLNIPSIFTRTSVTTSGTPYAYEMVIYGGDETSNRSGIEQNMNSHYLIYQPTDAPTSGLLATYTGAAAAYSVRQLSDKAVIALRIRRDSDDEEINIGFDANGDLDTTAISDFCSTANGYVTRWWDQSTNGNHADQATDASQPQIYNGTAVITENGKPMIKPSDANDGFSAIALDMSGSTISMFSVVRAEVDNSIMVHFGGTLTERMFTGTSGSTLSDGGQAGMTPASAELFFNGSTQGIGATRGEVYTQFYQNQTLGTWVGLTALNGTTVNISSNSNFWQMFSMQEIIFWESDQSSNRTGIESNVNTYFSIY